MKRLVLIPCATLGLVAFGCAPSDDGGSPAPVETDIEAPPDEEPSQVVLGTTVTRPYGAENLVKVNVTLDLSPDAVRPRIAELFVSHSEDLEFQQALAGPAATAAGKQVVGRARNATTVRLVVFSSGNVNTLESGDIAELRFVQRAAGPASVVLLAGEQVFAPAAANIGLVLSEPTAVASADETGDEP